MEIRIELVYHYPWLPSLNNVFASISSKDPIEFIKEIFEKYNPLEIKERVLTFFQATFENLEEILDYKIDKLNVYIYIILKILLKVINNKSISNRFANLYSKVNYEELIKENDYNIYFICKDLGLDVIYSGKEWKYGKMIIKDLSRPLKTNFKLFFIDYLNLAANLRDEYRKLVNNPLSEGYVFIQKRNLIRLIQEYVRRKIIIKEKETPKDLEVFRNQLLNIKEFKELYEEILNDWEKKKENFEYSIDIEFKEGIDISNIYPPCIKEILKKAQDGQNLIHNERLFIVWFLLSLNYPIDIIVNIFSTLPDFNREKTTYQVEYAKKKGYSPYKCLTLQSLNLCMASRYKDELCLKGYGSTEPTERKKLKHPLFYVQIKQYRAEKSKEYFKNKVKRQSNKESE